MKSNLADWQICMQSFKRPTSLSVWFTERRLGRLFMALVVKFVPACTMPPLIVFRAEAMQDLLP